jgi:uncharacterized membrane protein
MPTFPQGMKTAPQWDALLRFDIDRQSSDTLSEKSRYIEISDKQFEKVFDNFRNGGTPRLKAKFFISTILY